MTDPSRTVDGTSTRVGAQLKAIRKAKRPRVSRAALAHVCGLSASTIRALEEGERPFSLRTLHALSAALGLEASLSIIGAGCLVTIPIDP
jgi:transcriptional regulator with XRE-family HTH domain